MGEKKPYTHDSVQSALINHEVDGRVIVWTPPMPGESKYRLNLFDYGHWEGGLGETYALIVGLRVAQKHADRVSEKEE